MTFFDLHSAVTTANMDEAKCASAITSDLRDEFLTGSDVPCFRAFRPFFDIETNALARIQVLIPTS